MVLFLLIKRKKITIQKIFFPFIYVIMYKTKSGVRFMENFAKKFSKQIKYISYLSIVIGFLGMFLISFALLQNTYRLITKSKAVASFGIVLPVEARGVFYVPFFYWIISIFIVAVVHEFSHGIFAKKYGIKIKSSGLAFLSIIIPIVPAAFVEPEEEKLRKKEAIKQLSVFSAGPFSNILLAFIVIGVTILLSIPISNKIIEADGVLITGVINNVSYPAKKVGITENELIQKIDNIAVNYLENFSSILENKRPGDKITIETNKSSYNLILTENPNNKSKPYLGIYVQQHTKIKKEFISKYGKIIPSTILWFMGLLYWLYVLNFGIGLVNLAPMGPLDGGRMLLVILEKIFTKEKARRYWKNIGILFLSLFLINIMFSFLG